MTFCGDGAANQGTVLESLNLAAIWNLPVIFVVENNGYAESTSRDYATAVSSFADRGAGFGIPGVTVDGNDFFAVHEAAGEIIRRAREGGGPALLECRPTASMAISRGMRRPTGRLVRWTCCVPTTTAEDLRPVEEAGVLEAAELDAIDREVATLIEASVVAAQASPEPSAADLLADVYVKY